MVEIGVGERYAGNRRMAQTSSRVQLRSGFDLSSQVRGCSQKEPGVVILRDRNLGLAARLSVECAGAHSAAIGAGAVPLRKCAPSCGTENLDSHLW